MDAALAVSKSRSTADDMGQNTANKLALVTSLFEITEGNGQLEDALVKELKQLGLLEAKIGPMHDRASIIATRNEMAWPAILKSRTETAVGAVRADRPSDAAAPNRDSSDKSSSSSSLQANQADAINYGNVFNEIDAAQCDDGSSILSPSAYFVDLLQRLGKFTVTSTVTPTPASGIKIKTMYDQLVARRPDLAGPKLSCANTNTPIEYIDLVNEVLESFITETIKHNSADAVKIKAYNQDGDVNMAAYKAIAKDMVAPMHMFPYNHAVDTVRSLLAAKGASRSELLDVMKPLVPAERGSLHAANAPVGSTSARAIAAESLNLQHEDFLAITRKHSGRLTGTALRSSALIDPKGGALNVQLCQDLQAFIRRRRLTGLPIHILDAAISCLSGSGASATSSIDGSLIEKLAAVKTLAEVVKLEIDALLPLWGDINTDGSNSLYHCLFLKQQQPKGTVSPFHADEKGYFLPSTTAPSLSEQRSFLTSVLEIQARDLDVLALYANPKGSDKLSELFSRSLEDRSHRHRATILQVLQSLSKNASTSTSTLASTAIPVNSSGDSSSNDVKLAENKEKSAYDIFKAIFADLSPDVFVKALANARVATTYGGGSITPANVFDAAQTTRSSEIPVNDHFLSAISVEAVALAEEAYEALAKISLLSNKFALTTEDVQDILSSSASAVMPGFDVKAINLYDASRLQKYKELKLSAAKGRLGPLPVLQWMRKTAGQTGNVRDQIIISMGWDEAKAQAVLEIKHKNAAEDKLADIFSDTEQLGALQQIPDFTRQPGLGSIPADQLLTLAQPPTLDMTLEKTFEGADSFRNAVTPHSASGVADVANTAPGAAFDTLREHRRSVLIGYLLNQKYFIDKGFFFWIDVNMGATLETSRMKQAISRNELSFSSISAAIRNYVYGVSTVANLDVQAHLWERGSANAGNLHFFARTRTSPYQLYDRQMQAINFGEKFPQWQPWEKLDLAVRPSEADSTGKAIEDPGCDLMPVLLERKASPADSTTRLTTFSKLAWKVPATTSSLVPSYPVTKPSGSGEDLEAVYRTVNSLPRGTEGNRPFDPHAIARGRSVAYMKRIIMKYIEILIDAGDVYFRQNTLESIPLALQRIDMELEFPFCVVAGAGSESRDSSSSPLAGILNTTYFCVPQNPKLTELIGRIDDWLFKIRNGRDINGNVQKLALYEPPMDPGALVASAARGELALELCNEIRSIESAFLAAREKKDSEAFSPLKGQQDMALQNALAESRKLQKDEAVMPLASQEEMRKSHESRLRLYLALMGETEKIPGPDQEWVDIQQSYGRVAKCDLRINNWEKEEMDKSSSSPEMAFDASILEGTGSILRLLPQSALHTSPFGVGPALKIDSYNIADSLKGASTVIQLLAQKAGNEASQAGRKGQMVRQLQERRQEADQAGRDIKSTDKQIAAARVRIAITEAEGLHEPQLHAHAHVAQGRDERFRNDTVPVKSVAISSGQQDTGVFELNFRDERYLPFEGAGVISKWMVELPTAVRQFDYDSIADVVLHFRYTSLADPLLKSAAEDAVRKLMEASSSSDGRGFLAYFDIANDFPNEWNASVARASGSGKLLMRDMLGRMPFWARDKTRKVMASNIHIITDARLEEVSIQPSEGDAVTPKSQGKFRPNSDLLVIGSSGPVQLAVSHWTLSLSTELAQKAKSVPDGLIIRVIIRAFESSHAPSLKRFPQLLTRYSHRYSEKGVWHKCEG
ncbi:hypothetical protein B0H63DRAFT_510034 [Podospora didyma]|uniref:Uncharacterized protein n=1 Tax=Podospora didyma TaxID=330526 RepID=A0AAE0NP43_9PEZI|nr:hypothetical protein B0H63DRAFT_510034 [Podospora didyma]